MAPQVEEPLAEDVLWQSMSFVCIFGTTVDTFWAHFWIGFWGNLVPFLGPFFGTRKWDQLYEDEGGPKNGYQK